MTTFAERSDEMCNDVDDLDALYDGCGDSYCDICGVNREHSSEYSSTLEYLRALDDGVNYEDDEG